MSEKKGVLSEYFCSFQGEGLLVGQKQFFIRFQGCNIPQCRFCDTRDKTSSFTVTSQKLVSAVLKECKKNAFEAISLTGGEPLLQADFIKAFLSSLCKKKGFTICLETNATLPDGLLKVAPFIDWVSADYKLSSVTNQKSLAKKHDRFFQVLEQSRLRYFIKSVVSESVKTDEFSSMCRFLRRSCPGKVLVLQPEMSEKSFCISRKRLFCLAETALKIGCRVRIIPQIHKILNFP
ncbi:MAG: 7-carboxy-7-deazaguanine synthase QueE [Candidatus Aureabacteria bacterium]|nr:7-carboxy-7-deazaguanine synthase QueE [Candidatus Auribacterota bacterium]